MKDDIWIKMLKILELDAKINEVIFNNILSKMNQVSYDNSILVLSCRDEYSLNLVKGRDLDDSIRKCSFA